MSFKWHRLHLSDQSLPPLLFQYTWTRQGYEFYVTDLTYIWSERLPQKQITKRAEENATTIDPGEDSGQLDVLLEKIGEALQKGKDTAKLSSGTQTDSLEITTTTKLPAPLKPLRWVLKLSKESSSYLTGKLLFPLLKEEANWELRQRSLLRQIKQKDYVLSKLFDKIESIGVDLGSVFPSAAGSRKSHKTITRSEAARFVKGIEPFEEQAWLAETEPSEGVGLATNLLQEISESGDLHDFCLSQPRDEWWRELTKSSESSAKESSPAREKIPRIDRKNDDIVQRNYTEHEGELTASSDDEDDEFQRQETPPRLKSEPAKNNKTPPRQKAKTKGPSPMPLPLEAEDEATASDSEPGPAPRRNRIPTKSKSPEPSAPQPQEGPKKPKGGLGIIGGKKKKEKEKEPSVPPTQARSSPKPQESPKSPEKEEIHNDPSLPASPAPPPAATKAKRLGKLGMIGGKAKAKAKDTVPDDTTLPTSETLVASPDEGYPVKPKDTQDTTKKIAKKEESPLPALPATEKATPVPPAEPETEDQRANRRREELKRTLEAKSKVPAKKKRRF